jgi:hypothetical protein
MVSAILYRLFSIDLMHIGKLYLHPVQDVQQLRPSLTYLDAAAKKQKRARGGDDSDDDGPPPDPDEPAPAPTAPKVSAARLDPFSASSRLDSRRRKRPNRKKYWLLLARLMTSLERKLWED